MVIAQAHLCEHGADVLHRLLCLFLHGLSCQLSGIRIDAQLSGKIDEISQLGRLGIRPQRLRRLVAVYGFYKYVHIHSSYIIHDDGMGLMSVILYLIFLKFQRRCALQLVFLSDEHLSGL